MSRKSSIYSDLSGQGMLKEYFTIKAHSSAIDDYYADEIVTSDRSIYYVNGNDNNKVFRINLDGGDRKQVVSSSTGWLNCYRGLLFYSNKSDNDRLYVYIHLIGDCRVFYWSERFTQSVDPS